MSQDINVTIAETTEINVTVSNLSTGGEGGFDRFTDLLDTPNSYTGQGGKVVKVNAGATALEFATDTSGYITSSSDTSTVDVTVNAGNLSAAVIQSGIDHGSISGLSDDDHPQYLNTARGDARYYTESETDTLLANKQPLDADLTAVAGLSTTGIVTRTGSGTATTRTITAGSSKIAVTNGNGVSGNPTVDLGTVATTDITGFTEAVQDTIGTSVAAGTGISVSYDDPSGITTITATGGDAFIQSVSDTATVNLTVAADELTADVIQSGIDHGSISGLGDDDHTQYHNNTRGDARYYTKTQLDGGQLDNRYYTETETDTLLGGKANTVHTHTASQVTDFDAEVSNNTDVAANTAARHAALTVTDSPTVNLTLTAQDLEADVIDNSSIQQIEIGKAGTVAGTRKELNFIEGTNITLTVADDIANDRVNVTVAASGGGSGEANTASNVGTAGVGVFKQKTGVDLEFKKINAGSNKVTITDDTGDDEVDIDVSPANIAAALDTDDIAQGATNLYNQTHTGDVTGATALTIANNAVTTAKIANDNVTFAKVQNIATSRVLGRTTASSGDIEELTPGAGISLSSGTISVDATAVDHATLTNLNSATYTHLTAANHTDLTDGGDSTLHFHSADRARANHTGTQTASTVSDFDEAAQDAVGGMVDSTLTYVDATPALGRSAITGDISVPSGSNTAAISAGVIVNADINASAAIDATKIADGSVTSTEFQYIGGLTSDAQTQINGKANTVHTHTASDVTDFTEAAQDAIGGAFDSTLVYTDGSNAMGRAGITGDVTIAAGSNTSAIGAGVIVNADINASAAIDATKIADGSVTSTEFQYLGSVTSDIQGQINGKQASDATLTSLAAYNTDGLITQTAADTFTGRTLTAGGGITVTNGNGVSGNPTIASNLRVMGQSGAASSVTSTTNETALATVTIPANTMGANGALRINMLFSFTNNANAKTLRIRLGGISGTIFMAVTSITNQASLPLHRIIMNRNATNSQITQQSSSGQSYNVTTSAVTTGAVDTTASQDLVITGQLTNTGDTITLEYYSVELLTA